MTCDFDNESCSQNKALYIGALKETTSGIITPACMERKFSLEVRAPLIQNAICMQCLKLALAFFSL